MVPENGAVSLYLNMTKESPIKPPASAKDFRLHIPKEIELRLRRCRTSIRQAIRTRLEKITQVEAARPTARRALAAPLDPPLRFYASESYRVTYRIDRPLRKVMVLALRWEADG